ncbi:MAG TPA: hypothetical protein VIS96_11565 [Terrimicrobiaceae bacterium]
MLIQTVVESLLRAFLGELDEDVKFSALVGRYEEPPSPARCLSPAAQAASFNKRGLHRALVVEDNE